MSNLCIIPARAGSKRILYKNFRDFLGKPMICYAIETALKSNLFAQIIVSTDSPEIMDIVDEYSESNLTFLRRLPENATDSATTIDVINEVLNFDYVAVRNYDRLCCLYPCTPLLTVERLHQGFNQACKCDCSMSIVKYSHPIQRAISLTECGILRIREPKFYKMRTQDLNDYYYDAGQFYWARIKGLKDSLPYGFTEGVEIPESECQDIDNGEDWIMAEIKFHYMKNSGKL